MPTTTKMGIVYPSSTDLVKDGATAMGTISTTVDAKTGLVLLSTASFSAVASVSLATDTFTSNYNNYVLMLRLTSSAVGVINWRGRTAGTDNTTANYQYQGLDANNTTAAGFRSSSQTSGYLGYSDAGYSAISANIFDPKNAQPTGIFAQQNRDYTVTSSQIQTANGFKLTTSFDSMTIYINSATITGTYSIYGLNI